MTGIPDRDRLNFSWLMKLRWAQVAGQAATILGVYLGMGIGLPLAPLAGVVAVGLASNVVCELWFRRQPLVREWHVAGIMALDVALLTGLLYYTGGPYNPFSFLYLVQIALAAVVLHAHWTWMLVALSLGSFGLLLLGHRRLDLAGLDAGAVHEQGMWVALGVASAFIVHFLLRATTALAARERELADARNLAARQERLASLATMAAGAAHELSTPLSTIALVGKELERQLERDGAASSTLVEDARLIREQAGRCRAILDQMAGGAGASSGEAVQTVALRRILDDVWSGIREQPAVRVDTVDEVREAQLSVPLTAVVQALRSLVTNAQDASPADKPVVITATTRSDQLVLRVSDEGGGMPAQVLARAGEPFFTTKEPGKGMGLGLFLTRAVIESLGGRLQLQSVLEQGTTVTVTLPRSGGGVASR